MVSFPNKDEDDIEPVMDEAQADIMQADERMEEIGMEGEGPDGDVFSGEVLDGDADAVAEVEGQVDDFYESASSAEDDGGSVFSKPAIDMNKTYHGENTADELFGSGGNPDDGDVYGDEPYMEEDGDYHDGDEDGQPYPESGDDEYQDSKKSPEEVFGEADEDGDYEKVDQEAGIFAAEPSKKSSVEESFHQNKAGFLNRSKLTTTLLIAGAAIVLFLFLAAPYMAPKRKVKKAKSLETANKNAVPSVVSEISNFNFPEETEDNEKRQDDYEDEDFESMFPDPVLSVHDAPVYEGTPVVSSYYEEVDTSRNEQQKAFMDVPLSDSRSQEKVAQLIDAEKARQNLNKVAVQAQQDALNYRSYTPAEITDNTTDYNAALAALIMQGISTSDKDIYSRINDQMTKQKFLKDGAGTGGQYKYNTAYSLWKGTVIPAVLDTAIDTDLPGLIKATVTENVYSSQSGEYLLIPQGSQLVAEYNSSVSYAQERVQVAWQTLIRPDGLEINLGNLPGIEGDGSTGYKGKVNHHTFELAKGLGLIAVFTILDTKIGNQLNKLKTSGSTNKGPNWAGNNYRDNFSDVMTDAFGKVSSTYTENAMAIQPSIRKEAGTKISLITNVTMDIPPLKREPPAGRYILQKK